MLVRMRIDGVLQNVLTVPSRLQDSVVARLKVMGNLDIAERRIPQDGRIALTVAGHCHGGQVRIGRQGLYAPGQGVLPRLTSGLYFDDRLLVSRGVTNATWAPRINCGCEVILLHLDRE